MRISRRRFIESAVSAAGAAMLNVSVNARAKGDSSMPSGDGVSGAIVICNHWTQFGIGETFPEGEIGGRWYRRNFSTVLGLEQGRRWLESDPRTLRQSALELAVLHTQMPPQNLLGEIDRLFCSA